MPTKAHGVRCRQVGRSKARPHPLACNSRLRGDLHAICSDSHRARRVLLSSLGLHRRNDPPRWPARLPTRSRFRPGNRATANKCTATRSCLAPCAFRNSEGPDNRIFRIDRIIVWCSRRCADRNTPHLPILLILPIQLSCPFFCGRFKSPDKPSHRATY